METIIKIDEKTIEVKQEFVNKIDKFTLLAEKEKLEGMLLRVNSLLENFK